MPNLPDFLKASAEKPVCEPVEPVVHLPTDKPTRLEILGLAEGMLSLPMAIFTIHSFMVEVQLSRGTGAGRFPVEEALLVSGILSTITIGLAIGGLRHGYSSGNFIAKLVLIVMILFIIFWSSIILESVKFWTIAI